jgi:hypothetical protein
MIVIYYPKTRHQFNCFRCKKNIPIGIPVLRISMYLFNNLITKSICYKCAVKSRYNPDIVNEYVRLIFKNELFSKIVIASEL